MVVVDAEATDRVVNGCENIVEQLFEVVDGRGVLGVEEFGVSLLVFFRRRL